MEKVHIVSGLEPLDPIPNVSLGRHLFCSIKSHGDKIALVDAVTGETRTYSEVLSRSISVAEGFISRGIKTGDVISICSENSIDFILPVLATWYIGAVCAPINPTYTTRELLHALNISKPSIIFCSEKTLESVDEVSQHVEFLKEIVVFGHPMSHKHTSFSRFLQYKSSEFQPVDVDPKESISAIMCSSGTTGLSKGVMLTHHNLFATLRFLKDPRFEDLSQEVILGLMPMFHIYAFNYLLATTDVGSTILVMNRFTEKLFLESIQNHKITVLLLVPPLAIFLAKATIVENYDLTSLRSIRCGGSPLNEEMEVLLQDRLRVRVKQAYGLTETSAGATFSLSHKSKSGSCGVLIPDVKCKVLDLETGKTLGPNRNGELCLKGPTIMKGYCGDVEATSAIIDNDGFLHTGDVGYYDEDGFFFIVDRVKELIKCQGFQVPPAELEAILLTHPGVEDAGVIGIPDDIAGEFPMAFIVKQPGSNVTKEEIISYVNDQVSLQKRLHGGVEFVKTIPKTASGKILRRELKLMLE